MGVLRSTRHEAFAQAIANGQSASQAYEIAGFCRDRANAARLRHRDDISRRVDEILATRTKAVNKALVSAAEKAGVDQYWVMRTLRRNAVMAARRGDTAASNRAVELIGRHIGMFIDRKSIEISYLDDADAYLQRLLELVGQPVLEHEPLQLEQQPLQPWHDAEDGHKYGSHEEAEKDTIDIAANNG